MKYEFVNSLSYQDSQAKITSQYSNKEVITKIFIISLIIRLVCTTKLHPYTRSWLWLDKKDALLDIFRKAV
jgi:hypothetical protein